MIITPLLYLLGSFYGFIAADFTKSMDIKLSMIAGMVMVVLTFYELYQNKFKMSYKVGRSIAYNLGMLAVMVMAAFTYGILVKMIGKKL